MAAHYLAIDSSRHRDSFFVCEDSHRHEMRLECQRPVQNNPNGEVLVGRTQPLLGDNTKKLHCLLDIGRRLHHRTNTSKAQTCAMKRVK